MLNELRDCFREDFSEWLLSSNCSGIGPFKGEWWMESSQMRRQFSKIEMRSLKEILDVLITYPEADYFWYNYKKKLTYSLPHDQEVPGNSITVDSNKVKAFLRDIKINQILE